MPYHRRKTHSRFTRHLTSFFPSRIRIERPAFTQSASGAQTPSGWDVIYDNVPATITPVIRLGEEWRNWRIEFVLEQPTHRIMLRGYYPDIKASDRLVTEEGEIHNITSRDLDSHSTLTRLDTRIVSPEAVAGI